ncbi:MAG: flotillin family protein [Chloroflexi bacterium]|nr:flotillin family protein [Chloroflexota bacterium]
MNPATIWYIVLGVVVLWLIASTVRFIPNNRIGVVEKRFAGRGSVKSGFIALHGEAGYQPDILRGGLHLLMPFQYRVQIMQLITIPQGSIGYVFARDGEPLEPGQALGHVVQCNNFQDVRAFLQNGGQRGPQRSILREGTYAINLAQFAVITQDGVNTLQLEHGEAITFSRMAEIIEERGGFKPIIIRGSDDVVGIITVHDGPSLPQGAIIAPTVGDQVGEPDTYHNNFQDPEAFLRAGGLRGRQYQVIVEGTYYINRLFATVELIPKTIIDVGWVGVVVSYTGEAGRDLSGEDYKHGELVLQGERGVWNLPLMPGKYAFNTYAGKVIAVPTTNFILKWVRAEQGVHGYDANLAEVNLITKDAFEPELPLSVVVHIDYRKAPLVIQRFGDIKRLVEQTLDPMVAAYFKNIAQTRTLIQLIQERGEIQRIASSEMKEKFLHYNLELEEVLIGTPLAHEGDKNIETILTQLRSRQIAEEQVQTYAQQEKAAFKERELREVEARARQQQALTESEIGISIQSNQGKAEYQRAIQQAAQIRTLAEAEAEKVARVGIGQALAIQEQVDAYGGPRYQVTQTVMNRFAEAIEKSRIEMVPRVLISSGKEGGGGGTGSVLEALLTMLLTEQMGEPITAERGASSSEYAQTLKEQIRSSLAAKAPTQPDTGKPDTTSMPTAQGSTSNK